MNVAEVISPRHPRHRHRISKARERGEQVISLTETIEAGGLVTCERVFLRGRAHEHRQRYLVPRLAVCGHRSNLCFTTGVQVDGSVEFTDDEQTVAVDTTFTLPRDYMPGEQARSTRWHAWTTLTPVVPPEHHPERDRVILFEAGDWRWSEVPQSIPGDPALLRPLGGDLYAVEAVWELSTVERQM
jgi:hypothetical protein